MGDSLSIVIGVNCVTMMNLSRAHMILYSVTIAD